MRKNCQKFQGSCICNFDKSDLTSHNTSNKGKQLPIIGTSPDMNFKLFLTDTRWRILNLESITLLPFTHFLTFMGEMFMIFLLK